MPIVDNVLIGAGPSGKFEFPAFPCGEYFADIIRKNVQQRGDAVWMTDASTGKSMKYSDLLTGMDRIASALCKRGFEPNDSALFMASNHIELPLTFFGVWRAGGNAACLTLNLHPNDIRDRAIENRTKFILTDEDRAPRVVEAVKGLDFVKEVLVIGKADGCTPIDQLLQDDGQSCPATLNVDLDSLAWLMYSSGTTGVPKGIVHTHRNLNAIIRNYTMMSLQNRKFLFINLMINGGGMGAALLATVAHANAIVMSRLSDDNLLKAIHENKPQVVSAFPSQIAWLCRHPQLGQFDVSSVVVFVTSGSTINPIYERDIFDRLPNLLALNIAYGLSETSLVTSNAPTPQEFVKLDKKAAIERHVIGSCGKVVPYCKVKIIDRDSGKVLGPGEIGEVVVYTPYLMKEYLNKPKETAETIRDGWCYTGDEGYYDTNENLFIIGRYKELIKYRMAHVVPTNIEKHMLTHPAVEDCGVVGLPHDVDGELPLAFVVLRPGASVTPEELVQYTNERVIEEEKLRGGVRFIEKIPRNDFGKIIRPQLRKLL